MLERGLLYLNLKASWNSVLFSINPKSTNGKEVSQLEAPFSHRLEKLVCSVGDNFDFNFSLLMLLLWGTSQSVALANARDLSGSVDRMPKSTLSFPKCSILLVMVAGHSSQCLTVSG